MLQVFPDAMSVNGIQTAAEVLKTSNHGDLQELKLKGVGTGVHVPKIALIGEQVGCELETNHLWCFHAPEDQDGSVIRSISHMQGVAMPAIDSGHIYTYLDGECWWDAQCIAEANGYGEDDHYIMAVWKGPGLSHMDPSVEYLYSLCVVGQGECAWAATPTDTDNIHGFCGTLEDLVF